MNLIKTIGIILIFILGLLIQPILWFVSLFVPDDKTSYYHNTRSFVRHNSICDKYWHDLFHSEMEFQEFETKMTSEFVPIGATSHYEPKPKVKFLFYQYGAQEWEGGFIYKCKSDGKLWELSVPENAYRGYFKGIDLNEKEIEEYLK
ncbi:hypothetical protein [Flagellimonas sp.]|uniref:hypothetical protein n=1 Tax=Flagellimonas sp. TaxID=2058762 RepID=UPI003BB0A4A3